MGSGWGQTQGPRQTERTIFQGGRGHSPDLFSFEGKQESSVMTRQSKLSQLQDHFTPINNQRKMSMTSLSCSYPLRNPRQEPKIQSESH